MTARDQLTQIMSERDLQQALITAARCLGYLVYFTLTSKHSPAGFPDLVMLHPTTTRMAWWELKSASGAVSPEQQHWLEALARLAAASPLLDVRVVRPGDLDMALALLQEWAREKGMDSAVPLNLDAPPVEKAASRVLTTRDAAFALGLSVRRVQDLCRQGKLQATRKGRDWLIEMRALWAVADRPKGRPRKGV